jgi:hypothetical protein
MDYTPKPRADAKAVSHYRFMVAAGRNMEIRQSFVPNYFDPSQIAKFSIATNRASRTWSSDHYKFGPKNS